MISGLDQSLNVEVNTWLNLPFTPVIAVPVTRSLFIKASVDVLSLVRFDDNLEDQ